MLDQPVHELGGSRRRDPKGLGQLAHGVRSPRERDQDLHVPRRDPHVHRYTPARELRHLSRVRAPDRPHKGRHQHQDLVDEPLSLQVTTPTYLSCLISQLLNKRRGCQGSGDLFRQGRGTIWATEGFWKRRVRLARGGKALVAVGTLGALAAVNWRLERGGGSLSSRLGGEARYYRWRGGDLAYAVAGEGEPLLLVHGVYAGASSFEFRKNFEELSKSFRVYAVDLLGCGMSERPRRRYGPEDVAVQVEDFVREEVGGSAHLVASSLTAALVMPAVVRSPRLFKKLVLICPTGYGTLDRQSGRLGDVIYGLFLAPIVGSTLYHAIVSRWGLRYYLGSMAYHD